MGGLGSGRWRRTHSKRKTHELPRLDVRQLQRDGGLLPNTTIHMHGPGVHCTIRRTASGLEIHEAGQVDRVRLTWRPCALGGARPVLHCPRCHRPVYLLYRSRYRWQCRRCAALVYPSQSERACNRAIDRANRLRRRLDPDNCLMLPIPPRPKGMHHKTYQRLVSRITAHETGLVAHLTTEAERLRESIGAVMAALDGP